jgi:hypothetical protein
MLDEHYFKHPLSSVEQLPDLPREFLNLHH